MLNHQAIELSVVIPVYNEADNIKPLYKELKRTLDSLNKIYEIIYTDDGSNDSTTDILGELSAADDNLKVVVLRRNFGQTAALDAGIKNSTGNTIVTMDADLQNDPADIPKLIFELDNGYDCVSGWRYPRNDPFMKKFLSRLADKLRRFILKDNIHDSGCTLKAFRRECFDGLNLFGDTHRFIPAILHWKGFKIGEIKVNHRPRVYGKSKYRFGRVFRGLIDLLVLRFWNEFSTRPAHLFGITGLFLVFIGFLAGLFMVYLKFIKGVAVAGRLMPFVSVILLIAGIQFIVFGLLADIMIQIYYGSPGHATYKIKEVINNERVCAKV